MCGELKNGFKFDISEEKIFDMAIIDAIAEIDEGNIFALSKLCKLMFTAEEKADLYERCKTDGVTKPETVLAAIMEIFEIGGAKN